MKHYTRILTLLAVSALFLTALLGSCSTPEAPDLRAGLASYPGTDIWGESLADPGNVSDLGPGMAGPNVQRRQLPSRKVGEVLGFDQTRFHVATIDRYIFEAGVLVGYWMEADTVVRVTAGGLDTTLRLARCRFFAGLDSYPSKVGYKDWTQAERPVVRPSAFAGEVPIFRPGDRLVVRADMSLDGQSVAKWWISEP